MDGSVVLAAAATATSYSTLKPPSVMSVKLYVNAGVSPPWERNM